MDKAKTFSSKRISFETKMRKETQAKIIEKFGQEAISEATQGLCSHCKGFCNTLGLPLCLDGSDCSYFQENDD